MADLVDLTGQRLDDEQIFARIDVLPPYYALTDVALDESNAITATAPIEQPLGYEVGPISGAEAGRHLAICGSIAAAWANPKAGRFHYLATDAEIRRARGNLPADVTELRLRATGSMVDKRTAHATVFASTPDGQTICSLSCYYSVVGYDMMRKMFSDHCVDTPADAPNPYVELIDPEQVDIAGGHIEIDLGPVQPERCVGHFQDLPAMPVAYLMSNVTAAAGRLLQRQTADPDLRFSVAEGSVRADGLAFTGENVVLKGEHQGTRYGMEWLYLEAFADAEKRVGAVHLKVKPEPAAD